MTDLLLTSVDPFNATHKIGLALIFIAGAIILWAFFSLKKKPVKFKSKQKTEGISVIDRNGFILLGIFVAVLVALYIDGILEIIAGLVILFLALWLAQVYPGSKSCPLPHK
jgi:hypothetical protein